MRKITDELIKAINKPINPSLIRTRKGKGKNGSNELQYINAYTAVRMLNSLTDGAWDWTIDKAWKEDSLKDKYGGEQPPVCHVLGTLTLHFLDDSGEVLSIRKQGFGSKIVMGSANEQQSIYKSAESDALKKAASYFGIGSELYLEGDELDFFDALDNGSIVTWTDEMLEQHKHEWDFIKTIMEQYGLTIKDISGELSKWSGGELTNIETIPPDKLGEFVRYMKSELDSAGSEKASA